MGDRTRSTRLSSEFVSWLKLRFLFADVVFRAGVPHVALPIWFDTYDFATRVEWLGIGVWGNKSAAPQIDGAELGRALVRAVASDESVNMFLKAQEIMGNLGEGRVIACEKLIELLGPRRNEIEEQ